MPRSYTVLDSGILLATVQNEAHTASAKRLIGTLAEQDVHILAPTLLRYELASVVRKWVARGLTDSAQADAALRMLLRFPVTLLHDAALVKRGYEIAAQFQRSTAYDTQYIAVAERFDCPFWTADERLYNALKEKFNNLKWVGNLET